MIALPVSPILFKGRGTCFQLDGLNHSFLAKEMDGLWEFLRGSLLV